MNLLQLCIKNHSINYIFEKYAIYTHVNQPVFRIWHIICFLLNVRFG